MAVGEKENEGTIILVDGKERESAQGEKCGRDRERRQSDTCRDLH